MKYIYILCQRYLDMDLNNYTVGGIQTYIKNLTAVIKSIEATPVVIQYASVDGRCIKDGVTVIGVDTLGLKHLRHKNRKLHIAFDKEYAERHGLLIYATEGLVSVKHTSKIPTIAIQHGISWDKPDKHNMGNMRYESVYWFKALVNRVTLKRIEKLRRLICVDYNYVNWHRALVAYPKCEFDVIPNFTDIPTEGLLKKDSSIVKIIFARRFYEYRGTRIFANAINKLLLEIPDIDITIAGDGPDENWLREHLSESEKIHYIKYDSSESIEIHSDKHIAVIPTVGSEGTSLSLLEAMASKCAVVCTNVGGMTNIVIDGYNGLMVNPDEQALYKAIKNLIEDQAFRKVLADRAYDTVKNGFSIEIWKNKWKHILKTMEEQFSYER